MKQKSTVAPVGYISKQVTPNTNMVSNAVIARRLHSPNMLEMQQQ